MMEDEVRKKLKDFDDVLLLLNDMIKNIDDLIETVNYNHEGQGVVRENDDKKDASENLRKGVSRSPREIDNIT